MNQDGLQALRAFRGRLNDQLMKVPEYRAIAVIDRTIQEISEIYGALPPETERGPTDENAAPIPRAEAAPAADIAQTKIAMAIAEAIESNVSQLRMQRMPPATPYMLVGAAS